MHARITTRLHRAAALAAAVAVLAGALVLTQAPQAGEAAPGDACQASTALVNGDFEQPAIAATSYSILTPSSVPGWQTTDSGIELWSNGFNGTPSASGAQFAEINANVAGMLFQDVATTPGQTLSWSLLHRARAGTDVMEVLIGAPGGALVSQGPISDTTTAWGAHSGLYTVPAGQTLTRFGFNAVSTGSGSPSVGNFLDAVTFGNGSCLVLTTGMTNLTAPGVSPRVGDVLEYAVTVENQGGSPALASSISVPLPADLVYVPGSIAVTAGAGAGARTDLAGDDPAEWTGSDVAARIGSGASATAGGSIAPGTTTVVRFRATVPPAAALTTVAIAPVVSSTDSLSGTAQVQPAPQLAVPIPAAADLRTTVSLSDAAPVAGAGAPVWTATVTNAGPQAAHTAVVRVAVPAALGTPTVTIDGTPCPIAAGFADCPAGTIAVGGTRTIVLSGGVAANVPSGTPLDGTVSAIATEYDPTSADATAIAGAVVQTRASLVIGAIADALLVSPGDAIRVDLPVASTGPSDALAVTVAVTAPAGLTVTPSAGTWDAATGVWTIGTLTPGSTVRLRLTGTASALGAIVVRGELTSATFDPDTADDRAAASLMVAAPLVPIAPLATPTPDPAPTAAATGVRRTALTASAGTLAFTGTSGVDATGWLAAALLAFGVLLLRARRRLAARG